MIKNNNGKNFVLLMLVIALASLFLRVAIKQTIKANIQQNERGVSAILKTIATALENYAKDNSGAFPVSFSALLQSKPVYLDRNYLGHSPVKGYNFFCSRLDPSGYACSAAPTRCDITGSTVFSITTGGLLVSERCDKKEEIVR